MTCPGVEAAAADKAAADEEAGRRWRGSADQNTSPGARPPPRNRSLRPRGINQRSLKFQHANHTRMRELGVRRVLCITSVIFIAHPGDRRHRPQLPDVDDLRVTDARRLVCHHHRCICCDGCPGTAYF